MIWAQEERNVGTSLVVQFLRVCTPNAVDQVQSLVREPDPTCRNQEFATKDPVCCK